MLVSVLPSLLGGADGDERWSKVPCRADEFLVAVDRVLDQIRAQVFALGPPGEHWWRTISGAT